MLIVKIVEWLFPKSNQAIADLKERLASSEAAIINYKKTISALIQTTDNLKLEVELFKKRTEILEDSKGEAFQIPLRQVKTIVESKFSKFELVLMQSGIMKIARECKTVDDMEISISLAKKIADIMEKMSPEQEFTSDPGKA